MFSVSTQSGGRGFEVDPDAVMSTLSESLNDGIEWLTTSGTDWAIWLAVSSGLFLGLRFLKSVLAGAFKSDKSSPTAIRNIVGRVIAATTSLFLFVLSLVIAAPFTVELGDSGSAILRNVFMVVGVLQGAFWLRVIVKALMNGVVAPNVPDQSSFESARSLIGLFTNIAIFALAVIFILDNLNQDVGALIAGLGVGGIAIGLAAQNIFKDLFASLSIILDKPFVPGDFIIWEGQFMGTVERIGLKTTRIKSLSGEQLIVSNDDLLSNEIRNYKRMAERRISFKLGVTYQAPRAALEALPGRIREIIDSRELCRFDRSHLSAYGDSAINFETIYFVLSPDYNVYMDEQQEIYLAIHRLFEEMGLDFAYPTQTVWLEREDQNSPRSEDRDR